jgi:ABC-2 type transport system permease protein
MIFGCTFVRPSWDASESRSNSFSAPDERALQSIRGPLSIEVHLAAEDPRRVDLRNRALSKLQRLMPGLRVRYVSATSIGLFEQSNAGYGEIWYDLAGSRTMSRSTTEEGVLEAIYSLAHITPPVISDDEMFRGHPLAALPQGAGTIFYALWPGFFLASATLARRRLK